MRIIPVNHLGPGGSVRLGRNRPKPHVRRMLARYKLALPTAPTSVDYHSNVAALTNVLANDSLGDCTAAGACHIVEAATAVAGSPVTMSAADAVRFYELSTGYNPDNPASDQGGDEVTVLNAWRDHGLDGKSTHAIAGYVSLDTGNAEEIKAAMATFGPCLYFGLELADTWANNPNNGFVWDVGAPPDPDDGHCVVGVGYDDLGVQIDSWGLIGTITWAAIAQFCSEAAEGNLFAVLTKEVISKARATAPDGLDWDALVADFDGLGGTVAQPPSAPDPSGTFPDAGTITEPYSMR
jgi:hypothetical protein